jgi:prevent-host-death family protein
MYTHTVHVGVDMSKRYSVADARKNLPELLDRVAKGSTVEITRRGEPVAVVLPFAEYRRSQGGQPPFKKALATWRARFSDADRDLDDSFFDTLRDQSPGRKVDL